MDSSISIVICTYNRADRLEQCLESLDVQTVRQNEFEVIVVDNNSNDRTQDVVRHFPVRYLLEHSQGASYARNKGTKYASAAYVGFLDDDVIVPCTWVEETKKLLEEYENIDGMGGPLYPYYTTPLPSWWKDEYGFQMVRQVSSFLKYRQAFVGANMVLRKDLLLSVNGFDENIGPVGNKLAFGEDTEIFQRIWRAKKDAKLYYSLNLWVKHWIQPSKMTVNYLLNRRFLSGLASYYLLKSLSSSSQSSIIVDESINLLKETIKAIIFSTKYRDLHQWLIERIGPICVPAGKIIGAIGFPMRYIIRQM